MTIDVVLDIHGTLVEKRLVQEKGSPKIVVGSHEYTLAHGVLEFLLVLHSLPDTRLSFFSAGNPFRNRIIIHEIVDSLNLFDEATLEQLYNSIYSFPSLTDEDHEKKKKLTGVIQDGDIDLEQTILIDDCPDFSARGEERNMLPVYSRFHESPPVGMGDRVLKTRIDNRLVRALGLILWSISVARECQCTLVEALTGIQWRKDVKARTLYRHRETNTKEVYELGLKAMRAINPSFQLLLDQEAEVYPWSGNFKYQGNEFMISAAFDRFASVKFGTTVDRKLDDFLARLKLKSFQPELLDLGEVNEVNGVICVFDSYTTFKIPLFILPAGTQARIVRETYFRHRCINVHAAKDGPLPAGDYNVQMCPGPTLKKFSRQSVADKLAVAISTFFKLK